MNKEVLEKNYIESLNENDQIVMFKLYDFTTILVGRLHTIKPSDEDKIKLIDDYCYLYRADGLITSHYTYGIKWIKFLDSKDKEIKTSLKVI